SALDLKLRQHMRHELRALQKRTAVTFIYITHDQGEALTMSDRVAVMSAGRIEQVGMPEEIYAAPATPFVAGFVGETNRFSGSVTAVANGEIEIETPFGRLRGQARGALSPGERATLFVRPERLALGGNGSNTLEASVKERNFEGAFVFLVAEKAGQQVIVQMLNGSEARAPGQGEAVTLHFAPRDAIVLAG
ncbi:MAG: ABC transporter ATP-binding protein, partial [Geminicoccales bacterium]